MDFDSDDGDTGLQSADPAEWKDETSAVLDSNEETNLDTDIVQKELDAELELRNKSKLVPEDPRSLEGLHQYYQDLFGNVVRLRYEDITSLFVDGNMFVVCADSLLISAMRKPYCVENGGQTLHLVYQCERLLQFFQRKGAMFEIVVFDIWRDILVDESVALARSVLLTHIMKNTSFKVYQFTSTWDPQFSKFVDVHKPGFLLIDFTLPKMYSGLIADRDICCMELVLFVQVLFAISQNLPCVGIEKIEFGISTMHAFTAEGCSCIKQGLFYNIRHLKRVLSYVKHHHNQQNVLLECITFGNDVDVRHVVVVMAAAYYLIEEKEKLSQDWIRAFLVYSAIMEVLPLMNRACPVPKEILSYKLITFIRKIQFHMECLLMSLYDSPYSSLKVADLWHGNLFISVLRHLSSGNLALGSQTEKLYLRFIKEVRRVSGQDLQDFPVLKSKLNWSKGNKLISQQSVQVEGHNGEVDVNMCVPMSCPLNQEFCGELLTQVHQQTSEYDDKIHAFIQRETNFTEVLHWRVRMSLTDEQDRIHADHAKPLDGRAEWKRRNDQKFATFMDIYGSNIEGRQSLAKPIVSKNMTSNKDAEVKKESKKALKIKEKKLLSDELKRRKSEESLLKNFKDTFKDLKSERKYDLALAEAKMLKKKLLLEGSNRKILIFIAKSCYYLWQKECLAMKDTASRDLNYAKQLFLSCREILKCSGDSLPQAGKQYVGKWLWHLGFGEVASLWELPRPESEAENLQVGLSWIRFQFLHLGADLERLSEGSFDKRVDFIPDPWQRRLLDIIDCRESAVIVAPTSSGKTYASYYCMETILREDEEGVVVYVSPTKALVNQVAATVYSRYKRKNMPEGKTVYGVFTQDYRTNDMNCQILVTVPECLEILLLSPCRQAWVRKLRYVIFDEIHCLSGQAGGLSWESGLLLIRCPFLALSATIGNPTVFHRWLQDSENFKKEQDERDGCLRSSYRVHLVTHTERHSDLKKYIYAPCGDMVHIHPYAYVDEAVIKEHGGIPAHVSLAPDETLQLYCVMEMVSQIDPDVLVLKPETYFRSKSFLTRSEVRNYENDLRTVLERWALNDKTAYNRVISQLKSQLVSLNRQGSQFDFVNRNFLKFICELSKKHMFPTILFHHDKAHINYLFQKFVKHCKRFERVSDPHTGNNQNVMKERKEKSSKALCKLTGKGADVMRNVEKAGDFSVQRREKQVVGSLGLLERSSPASIRNVGFSDREDVKSIEERLILSGYKKKDLFPSGLRFGLGKHHAAMSSREKSAVEMLFRKRVLNGILASGTLALGVHMPCKTVVISGNSPYINSLSYHQMSGRSGRRGFDTEGNVVFYGMEERKIRTVLTGKLPSMAGNFPLSVSLILRLLLLVNDVTERGVSKSKAQSDALSRALTFLNCNLVYQNIPKLKDQMKFFFAFSSQLLMLQGLLDSSGHPQKLCGLITHLHYHEPGNFVLAYLLRCGALQQLCSGHRSKENEMQLVVLLSHLFARLPLHPSDLERKYKNSKVILPDLPEAVKADIQTYNQEVNYIYDHYFRCAGKHVDSKFGNDNKLPLSHVCFDVPDGLLCSQKKNNLEAVLISENIPQTICSRFAAISGQNDQHLYSQTDVVSRIRHEVFTDMKFVPVLDDSTQLNGYAWDFYNHGILPAVIKDNGILPGDAFKLLKDFKIMLQSVCLTLEELGIAEAGPILQTFDSVKNEFNRRFNKAFSAGGI